MMAIQYERRREMGLVLHKMKVLVRWRALACGKMMCCNHVKEKYGDDAWSVFFASAAIFFTLFFGLGAVHAVAAPNITPIISLLLTSDKQSDTTKIVIGEKGLITAFKGKTLRSRITVAVGDTIEDNSKYSFTLLSGPSGLNLSSSGDIEYEVPSDAATSANSLQVKVARKVDGKSYYENGEIVIMVTEVVASGTIGPEGGRIADEWEDVVLTVPPEAVTEPTMFQVLRAVDVNGNFTYTIHASAPLLKVSDLHLPDLLFMKSPQSSQTDLNKSAFLAAKSKLNKNLQLQQPKKREIDDRWISWDTYPAMFIEIVTGINVKNRRSNKMGSQPAGDDVHTAKVDDAGQLLSLCYKYSYEGTCGERTPVLFVHGFTVNPLTPGDGPLGGGKDTWGQLPELLDQAGYAVFEFNWRTNARFEDAADDLARAISEIASTSGKKVYIVAHSFGGLLSRAYLQNYAASFPYNNNVAGLITLGTPHSGIFNVEGRFHDVHFKKGQDSLLFKNCLQLSCHEAGEPTEEAWTVDPWIGPNAAIQTYFGINTNEGEFVAKIQDTSVPVNVLVLMGLPKGLYTEKYENGDGLITFAGQRFFPGWGNSKVNSNHIYGDLVITEKILGVTQYDPDAVPGGTISNMLDSLWSPGRFTGYYHMSSVSQGVSLQEANVLHSGNVYPLQEPHATLTEIKYWLHASEAYNNSKIDLQVQVGDANSYNPIYGAEVYLTMGVNKSVVSYSHDLTDYQGNVTLTAPFLPNTLYGVAVTAYGYHSETFSTSYVSGETSEQTGTSLGAVVLQPNIVARGNLAGQVVSATTNQPLAGVSYTLSRNGIGWIGVTDASGNYSVSNLVIGTYELRLSKAGFQNETFYFTVRAGQTSNGNTSMREALSAPGTVISAGQVWMDRNLGASQVATSSTDSAAYGDLYQWGRGADGHQLRTSPTTATNSATDAPGHGSFVTTDTYPGDWRVPQNNSLWQGVSGTNNPCPSGFRLPTATELDTERASWASNNSAGAYTSPLKLVMAGYRFPYGGAGGALQGAGIYSNYWSSTVDDGQACNLYFNSGDAFMRSYGRAEGFSLRCLKD